MPSVVFSESTWQQPVPANASPERRRVIERIARHVHETAPHRLRVAVDGYTAAGKTSFGHELAQSIADIGRPAFRATLDDFKRPWSEAHLYDRFSGDGYYRNAQDLDAIHRLLLQPAAPEGAGVVALCSIDPITQIDHSGSRVILPDDAVLVVDGVFAFRPELDQVWDVRVWLHVDPELSLQRGLQRDAAMYGDAAAAEALHRERYHAAEAVYLSEVDAPAVADIVVDNTDFSAPRLVRMRT